MTKFEVKAIAFDAYGTLCYVSSPRNPYRQLFNLQTKSAAKLRRDLMINRIDLEAVASKYGIDQTEVVSEMARLVDQEVESVRLFPEVACTLEELKKRGFCLAIASNLAPPYAAPIKKYLSSIVDHFVFSYEVGAIKPERKIFQVLCAKLETAPTEVLMVGDSMKSDIRGAMQFGMQAIQVERKPAESDAGKNPNSISNIGEVLGLVDKKSR